MNLTEELRSYANQSAKRIPSEIREVMIGAIESLEGSGIVQRSINEGDQAPDFELPDQQGRVARLSSLLAEGAVVLVFYRGGWCPYCNLELRAYQSALDEIKVAGGNLVAISPQTPDHSLSTAEKNDLSYPVLSDQGSNVADAYGLTFRLPEELQGIYKEFGIQLPDSNGENDWRLPISATYVVSSEGKVIKAAVDTDYKRRLDPIDAIAALKSI